MAYDGSLNFDTKIDGSGFDLGIEKLKSSAKLGAAAIGAALAVAGAAVVSFSTKGIALASDLSEVQNVVDTTFGSMSESVNAFAKSAGESFGLSELQAKQFTSTIGAMLKSSGITGESLKCMSVALAGLAGDMASFYNLDPTEAFEKLRAGISGETEPLKQLGIDISDTRLQAYALEQGISKSTASMTAAEKATLRYGLIMEQTADAQGDFSKTVDSFANQQRILSMQIDTLAASLGSILLPTANKALGGMMSMLDELGPTFDSTFGALGELLAGTSTNVTETANTLGSGISTIATTIVGKLTEMIPVITTVITALLQGILQSLPSIITSLVGALTTIIVNIAGMLPTLIPLLLNAAVALFMALTEALPIILPALINGILGAINAVVVMLPTLIPMLIQAAITLFMALVEALPQIIDALLDSADLVITTLMDMLPTLIPLLLNAAVTLFFAIVDALPRILGALLSGAGELIGSLIDCILSYFGSLADAGGQLIAGVWQGISDRAAWLRDKISGFFGGVVDSIKSFFGIASPSKLMEKEIGINLALGTGVGFEKQIGSVVRDMQASVNAEMARFSAVVQPTAISAMNRALSSSGGFTTTNNNTAQTVNCYISDGAISDYQSLLASIKVAGGMGQLAEGMY
jgi:hypothetical protein